MSQDENQNEIECRPCSGLICIVVATVGAIITIAVFVYRLQRS